MAEPVARKRKDGTTAWYARVKLAAGDWVTVRLRAAKDKSSARKLNHELQEAEDRKAKGLAPGGALFIGTFGELCDFAWKKHLSTLAGAKHEASRLHVHGGAIADRDGPGPSPLGPVLAKLVDSAMLESYFADLATTPSAARGKPLSANAINRIRSTFSTVFTTAARFGKWPKDSNPAKETLERDVTKKEIRTLTVAQILPVLEAAGDYWDGPFAICLLAGLRRSEMLALLKRDVDLEQRRIIVRRSGERDTTKGDTHDAIPIHDELLPYLERWMQSPGPFMFPNHEGGQRSKDQRFDLRLQAAMVRAGIIDHYQHRCRCKECPLRNPGVKRGGHMECHPDDAPRRCPGCGTKLIVTPKAPWINFHATRHTFATAALESGASLQGVQKLMRHSDPRLTTEIYGHVSTGFLAEEVDRINLRGKPSAGQTRRAKAKGAKERHWATSLRIDRPDPAQGVVTPLRRGAGGAPESGFPNAEPSMKIASGMVEPRGIEPLTYALRMHGPATGDVPHASQTVAKSGDFSADASLSASNRSPGFAAVSSALVTPVRRGREAASQARETDRGMLEHETADAVSEPQPSASVLLPVSEVARRLRVSTKWVRYRIDLGELQVVRIGGSRLRVSEAALAAFIARGQR